MFNATISLSSGGGFSNVFPRPSYQDNVVKNWLAANPSSPPPAKYNATGRAFPDVAAIGQGIDVSILGELSQSAGTSAAAPIFASMITLVNEKRLAAGKKPVGFLNPTLYANPGMFTDVSLRWALFELPDPKNS